VIALAGLPGLCRAQAPALVLGPATPDAAAPAPLATGPFGSPSSAWFAGVEVGLFHAVTPVGTFATGENVKMDFSAELRAELGYRFDDGSALRLDYRNITSGGTGKLVSADNGAQAPRLHLEVNSVDLDYVSGVVPGLLHDLVSFEAGLRVASKLLDSRVSDSYEQVSFRSLFAGVGPHFGVSSALPIEQTGFAFYSRFDVALVFGGEQDRVASASVYAPDSFGGSGSASSRWEARAVGDATAQFGLSWAGSLGARLWLRAALGVQAEYVGFGGQQLVDFTNQNAHPLDGMLSVGPFFRCEIAY
jgi:hypothetical protein